MQSLTESANDALLARQRSRESNARTYPRRLPIALASGQGTHVTDTDGTTYLDCLAGAGSLALGHNHPRVVEAIEAALRAEVPLTTLDLTTPTKDAFVEALFEVLPAGYDDARIHFCGPTGADAVEAAVKLVKHATGRSTMVAFGGAYHGMTHGALALTGAREAKEAIDGLMPSVQFLPFPDAHRPVLGRDIEDDARLCARLLEWTLGDDHSGVATPAGIIFEPVQGEGGVNPAPASFAKAVRRSASTAGVPLIVDEVQTGLGRTGSMWGTDALGIEPDVLVLSKAIGGGLPLAVVVYRPELDGWAPGMHAGTFRGNQLAMAAGTATIHHLTEHRLADHAAAMGNRLVTGLASGSGALDEVGDVRGRGLMVGVELVDPDRLDPLDHPVPDGDLAARVQTEMLQRGVIVECGGRNGSVIRFLPPLIITSDEIDQVVDTFLASVVAARRARRS